MLHPVRFQIEKSQFLKTIAGLCLTVSQLGSLPAMAAGGNVSCLSLVRSVDEEIKTKPTGEVIDGVKNIIPVNLANATAIATGAKKIKMLTLNMENLRIKDLPGMVNPDAPKKTTTDDYRSNRNKGRKGKSTDRNTSGDDVPDKAEWKIEAQRALLWEEAPHFVFLQEVFKGNELDQFLMEGRKGSLAEHYAKFQIIGNDVRGIQISMLVRIDAGFQYKFQSFKDLRWKDPVSKIDYPLFSRDMTILWVFVPGSDKPAMALINNHPKSKRDSPQDKESTRWRTAQMQKAAEIIQQIQTQQGEDFPIFFGGDLQTDAQKGPELAPIRALLPSAFDVKLGEKDSPEQRASHDYFGDGGLESRQIDDIRVSPGVVVQNARILNYKDQDGNVLPRPRTFKERQRLPGDHRAMLIEVSLKPRK